MKASRLFITICGPALALALSMAFTACPNTPDDDDTPPVVISDYNDTPITTFAGTRWSDGQIPEDTITFSASTVNLEGRYFKKRLQVFGNTTATQALLDFSGLHPYEERAATEVESPYKDPNAAGTVNVIYNTDKRIGIQMFLYNADTATGKHQRLIVYSIGNLQAREFYLPRY